MCALDSCTGPGTGARTGGTTAAPEGGRTRGCRYELELTESDLVSSQDIEALVVETGASGWDRAKSEELDDLVLLLRAHTSENGGSGCWAMLETGELDESAPISFSHEVEPSMGPVSDAGFSWGLKAALGSSVQHKMFQITQ